MKLKKINKKADITSEQLVKVILTLIGFGILVLFIYFIYTQLTWTGMVDREVCHESVIYRGTLPGFGGTKEFVPLKCKTQKICITVGSGKCSEFEGSTGILKVKVKNKEEVEQFISREIIDCWKTMGEGKISIFSQWFAETYGVGSVYPTCVICSRIAFDKTSLEKSGINLNEVNVIKYMMTHAVPGQETSYYEYLAGQRGKFSVKPILDLKEINFDDKGNLVEGNKVNIVTEPIPEQSDDKELSVMFMQISSPKNVISNTATSLGLIWGAGFVTSPVLTVKATASAISSPVTWALLAVGGIYQYYSVSANKAVSASYCGDVMNGDSAREGCSVVRTINYNLEDISKYCSSIESIP